MNEMEKELKDMNALEELFDLWMNRQKEEKEYFDKDGIAITSFTIDGFVDEDCWKKQKVKVLYLLREANGRNADGGEVCEKGEFWFKNQVLGKKAPTGTLFKRIRMMQRILVGDNEAEQLKGVAYMNVNKRGGGSSVDWTRLIRYAKEYKDFIKREIEIINPDVIVCGGTYWLLLSQIYGIKDEKWDARQEMFNYLDGKIKVYNMWHPSARFSDDKYRSRFESIHKMINSPEKEMAELSVSEKMEKIVDYLKKCENGSLMDISSELVDELFYYIEECIV